MDLTAVKPRARAVLRLLAIHAALEKFAVAEPAKAQLVQMRYFAGLTNEQVAALLDISETTAKRWWVYARAWLQSEIVDADTRFKISRSDFVTCSLITPVKPVDTGECC